MVYYRNSSHINYILMLFLDTEMKKYFYVILSLV